jgi:hypothetical protein
VLNERIHAEAESDQNDDDSGAEWHKTSSPCRVWSLEPSRFCAIFSACRDGWMGWVGKWGGLLDAGRRGKILLRISDQAKNSLKNGPAIRA